MKFSQADPGDGYTIHAYNDNAIIIGERSFERSLILMPERIIEDWPVAAADQLQAEHFSQLVEFQPSLVLLGCGARQQLLSPSLYRCLTDGGIGVEVMTTAAACRTYNIIVAEGRAVAAALIL